MLTLPERLAVESALAGELSVVDQWRPLLQTVFLANAAVVSMNLPQPLGDPATAANSIVGECLISQWNCDPALLAQLLTYLINRGHGDFASVRDRVNQCIDPNPSPYEASWLIGGRPFFDRALLRRRVRRVLRDNGRPILRVQTGPDSFGRSYTRYFLEHLAADPGNAVHVVPIEVSRGTGPSYTIDDMLDVVSSQLYVDNPPLQITSSPSAAAARRILRQIGCTLAGRTFLLLDGFGDPGLNPDVRQTVEQLAVLVPSGQHRGRIRLVLIDYPQTLPGTSPADFVEEQLRPASGVQHDDLLPCLVDWNTKRAARGHDPMPDSQLVDVATGMLASVPAEGKQRLESLNEMLFALLNIDELQDQD